MVAAIDRRGYPLKGSGFAVSSDSETFAPGQVAPGQGGAHRRGLFALELVHRGARIHASMRRRASRRRRRGWLAPFLAHRVETTVGTERRLLRLFPITEVHVESVAFDTHAISVGKESLEAAEYHIEPRARGDSDRISNLTLACVPCNQTRASLRDAAAMNATRWQRIQGLRTLGPPVTMWSGGRTKYNRTEHRLAKSHTLDALCVGEVTDTTRIVRRPDTVLVATSTGRGSCARTRSDRRATVPKGKYRGTYQGRVSVRASGTHRVSVLGGHVDTSHKNLRLVQRADGYEYSSRGEGARR
ncbi:RRXRR domain-containing protein [Actinomycetota bacterium Odt1-20B]